MIFASFEFLCLFLPIFFAAYFLTPVRLRNWTILLFSWAFYAWWRIDFLLLLVGVTVFTFLVARAMGAAGPGGTRSRWLMVAGLVGNLGVLAYFKYANFGLATFNDLVGLFGTPPVPWAEIILPVGLSFYVLQSVSYLVDVQRRAVPVSRSFLDYAAYKAIFSQLIAGPIVRYAEVADDLRHRRHSLLDFGLGARTFMIGFAMKVAVADTLSPVVDAAFALARPSLADAWTGAACYTLQLYFDFAGYSLMAIGLARMMSFRFPQNFDHPYLASSIQDFWQRWHMTLSRFLRDYLYVPFGGNRRGPARTYVNLVLVMAIGGLWHGSSWNFVLWGLWHGGLLALHRLASQRASRAPELATGATPRGTVPPRREPTGMAYAWRNGLTLLAVVVGWVVFRAKDLAGAGAMYGGMVGLHGIGLSDEFAWHLTPDRLWCAVIAAGVAYAPLLLRRVLAHRQATQAGGGQGWGRSPGRLGPALDLVAVNAAFAVTVVLLYSRDAVPFLYFQF